MDFANAVTDANPNTDRHHSIHHRHTTYTKRSPIVMNRMKRFNNHHDGDESKERNPTRTSSSSSCLSPISIFTHLALGVVTFHIGFVIGGNYGCSSLDNLYNSNDENHITEMYQHLLNNLFPSTGSVHQINSDNSKNNQTITPIFPSTISKVFYGASTVRRDNFIQQYDIGVPWNEPKHGATDVLIMYQSEHSLPSDYHAKDAFGSPKFNTIDGIHSTASSHTPTTGSPIHVSYDSALEATSNCHTMKVILIEPNTKYECVAMVPQWESFHVQHFLRIKPENMTTRNKKAQLPHFKPEYPLRLVSRHDTLSGKSKARVPMAFQSKKYWFMLLDYLTKLSSTLERLKPLAATVITSSNNYHHSKTIVVMVCNFGQSELFVNFVCSARARNIDLSNVLLFATDQDMYRLAQSLGISTFDVQDAFGDMPTGAAKVYGDRVFQVMMLSKVYCVHLISALGYDVLFQDVDVVWYRNPIEYFQSEQSGDFDFYFQDGT